MTPSHPQRTAQDIKDTLRIRISNGLSFESNDLERESFRVDALKALAELSALASPSVGSAEEGTAEPDAWLIRWKEEGKRDDAMTRLFWRGDTAESIRRANDTQYPDDAPHTVIPLFTRSSSGTQ